jgi:hypothetical protein
MHLNLDGKGLEVLVIGNVCVDRLPDHPGSVLAELLAPFLVLSLDGRDLLRRKNKITGQLLIFQVGMMPIQRKDT